MKTWLLFVVHNCFAHPLLPFLPRRWGEKLHDATLWEEPLTVTVTSSPSATVPFDGDRVARALAAGVADRERWAGRTVPPRTPGPA